MRREERDVGIITLGWNLNWFFFPAEDGIRGGTVTGVQTSALPICKAAAVPGVRTASSIRQDAVRAYGKTEGVNAVDPATIGKVLDFKWKDGSRATLAGLGARSEERRVGKECRSRSAPALDIAMGRR